MPADELTGVAQPTVAAPETTRRPWQVPAVTRLDVVETTEAKPGVVADGDDFELS